MRIFKVQLTNIKSYTSQSVILAEGTNSICGHNGAGKSTILEAIGFALFDCLPYRQQDFVRDGSAWGEVYLKFNANDGRDYDIARRVGRGAHWYVHDPEIGTRVAEGSADVKSWISRQLGLEDSISPQVIFESAVGVAQGGLCAPFLQTAEKRKDAFNPVLRVHEYETAFDNLRETQSYIRERIRDQESIIATLSVEADKMPAIRDQISTIKRKVATTEHELDNHNRELERQEALTLALEAEGKRIESMRTSVNMARQGVDSVLESKQRAEADVEQAWRAHEIVTRSARGHKLYESAEAKLRALAPRHEEYRQTQQSRQSLVRDSEYVAAELERYTHQIKEGEAAEKSLPNLETGARELETIQAELHTLSADMRRLPSLRKEQADLASKLARGEAELRDLRSQAARIEKLKTRAAEVEGLRERQNALTAELQEARVAAEELKSLTREESRAKSRLVETERRVRELEKKIAIPPKIRDLAARRDEIRIERDRLKDEGNELKVNLAGIEARKEASTRVYCPLQRSDCMEIQQRDLDCKQFDVELREVQQKISVKRAEWRECDNELKAADVAYQQMQEVSTFEPLLASECMHLEERREVLIVIQERMPRYRDLAARCPVLDEQMKQLALQVKAAQEAANDVSRLTGLRDQIERRTCENAETARQKDVVASEIKALECKQAEIDGLKERIAEREHVPETLAHARVLVRDLPKHREARAEAQARRDTLAARIEQMDRTLQSLGPIEQEVSEAQQLRDENRQAHEQYLSNHSLAEHLSTRQVELKRLETDLEARTAELAIRQAELRDAEARWSAERLEEVRALCRELRQTSGQLAATIFSDRGRIGELEADMEACRQKARERDEALAEKKRVEDLLEVFTFTRDTIKAAQRPVTEALLYTITQEARAIFSEIVDDYSARLEWTPDYEIRLERGTERLSFNQLSGGEQMSAALAVRLALLKKLSDIDIAFLDEPTQNMDETRRTNLAAQVGSLSGFGQLFIISHDDTFERQVNHAVLVRKQNGESIVTTGMDG